MLLGHRWTTTSTMFRAGSLFLVAASLWKWFVHPSASFGDGPVDGITGLLYGISIASLLMSIRRKARPGPA